MSQPKSAFDSRLRRKADQLARKWYRQITSKTLIHAIQYKHDLAGLFLEAMIYAMREYGDTTVFDETLIPKKKGGDIIASSRG